MAQVTAPTKAVQAPSPRRRVSKAVRPAVLENGDRLTAHEFMRRYEAMPGLRKAQLIDGKVFMPSPVRADAHAEPDGLIQLWLGLYSIGHPELKVYPNATLILDADNAFQPDAILCSQPRAGGSVWLDEKGYLRGAPEFICEIAASSASIDLHAKFQAYRRHGVREYLVWLTGENTLRWFQLEEDDYVEKKARGGLHSSAVFPGLVLDTKALLRGDKAKLAAALKA
ncbi:MAG: Uma2 family endonuclease [Verrucomicrobiota bacterium]